MDDQYSAHALHPRKILVVDDNEDLGASLIVVLTHWGHDTRYAEDGVTALEILQTFNADTVISDICMPGMSGFKLACILRKSYGNRMYLIGFSSNNTRDFKTRAEQAGFDTFNGKPIDLADLQQLLN